MFKYTITQEFNKLTAYNFKARLTHEKVATKGGIADLLKKTDFYEKIKSLSKTITWKKKKIYGGSKETNCSNKKKLHKYQKNISHSVR